MSTKSPQSVDEGWGNQILSTKIAYFVDEISENGCSESMEL